MKITDKAVYSVRSNFIKTCCQQTKRMKAEVETAISESSQHGGNERRPIQVHTRAVCTKSGLLDGLTLGARTVKRLR